MTQQTTTPTPTRHTTPNPVTNATRVPYTQEMQNDHRIRILRKTAKRSGLRMHIPKGATSEQIDNAATELSLLISGV
jgi:hypothetical protein